MKKFSYLLIGLFAFNLFASVDVDLRDEPLGLDDFLILETGKLRSGVHVFENLETQELNTLYFTNHGRNTVRMTDLYFFGENDTWIVAGGAHYTYIPPGRTLQYSLVHNDKIEGIRFKLRSWAKNIEIRGEKKTP